ncbi:acyl-CoA dehydrogenase family protein [Roseofilum casamattae]|uniref:Acyl-CoA/acyl-ACP dehydrogenase n=1 Tax=Roseofilum casamattae BLCC-M143 TaxID=3022442 RepID=A0ABT7BTQ7_9CYAN|nr:acyl-CoA dehydrogenase family protein [Roseofilum casamattae]MDJ1182450.1 acyl-CoA/acyl-ACP dehydrogenase [Roseofilum casamattae BLCC-M143]
MQDRESIIPRARSYFLEDVAPRAIAIDRDPDALKIAFTGLGDRGLLALCIPQQWGGVEASSVTWAEFTQLVARYSGALAFLQAQHEGAARILVNCDRQELKQEYLPLMNTGKRLLGVGVSHLRRSGIPPVKATPVQGGYRITGTVPWITGFGIFSEFIVAAALTDGRSVFGIAPFRETADISISPPMELAAVTSTNTVSATLNDWFLAEKRVAIVQPPGWIQERDKNNALKFSWFSLGCARAGLDLVENAAKMKQLSFINEAFLSLDRELNRCCQAILEEQNYPVLALEKRLELRARAIDLAVRCAHAAVAVSSGAANTMEHNAQRIYREALVFTVFGQTTAVMEATLSRLISSLVN